MEGRCMMKDTKCNILVLTSLYPADDIPKSDTPVVHYFTKEWVKKGCNVQVVHFAYNLPKWAFWIIRTFPRLVSKCWGGVLRTKSVDDREYCLDGVPVRRFPLKKNKARGRYKHSQIEELYNKCIEYLTEKDFKPDVIISHWSNPQLEIMSMLKSYYQVPTVYVAHNRGAEIEIAYGLDASLFLKSIDLIGFRSGAIENEFRARFNYDGPGFRCNSGIPVQFVNQEIPQRDFSETNCFIYVGTFIKRKYADAIIPSVKSAMGESSYTITFIGRGNEEKTIRRQVKNENVINKVKLLGYVPREEVNRQLKSNDVFIMISKGETFGLVYLEAMSTGCITIASKGEGMDGVIKHGVNGFLCTAGDVEELTSLIRDIRNMPKEKLKEISKCAVSTARELTDKKVAEDYLTNIQNLLTKQDN